MDLDEFMRVFIDGLNLKHNPPYGGGTYFTKEQREEILRSACETAKLWQEMVDEDVVKKLTVLAEARPKAREEKNKRHIFRRLELGRVEDLEPLPRRESNGAK